MPIKSQWICGSLFIILFIIRNFRGTYRGGLNEREAPGKVVTVRPPKRLAQLRSVSHALV